MSEKYFVLYERDVATEQAKEYDNRMLFDKLRYCRSEDSAREFAFMNMPAILAMRSNLQDADLPRLRDREKPYVAAARYYGKYHSSCMGETEALENYDAIRCSAAEVESMMEKLASEPHFKDMVVGLELKLF